jgi:hypothetical protein
VGVSTKNLHPQVLAILRRTQDVGRRHGLPSTLISAYRPHHVQQQLYNTRGMLPVAPPGDSQHEYGYAFDLAADNPNQQGALAGLVQGFGMFWGGEDDPNHFQLFNPEDWAIWLRNARITAPETGDWPLETAFQAFRPGAFDPWTFQPRPLMPTETTTSIAVGERGLPGFKQGPPPPPLPPGTYRL